jgi:hypothetical protein
MKTKHIFYFLILLLSKNHCFAQSCHNTKELYRKRHTISGITYGHPYTTFDRHNNLSFEKTIQNIRDRIILENGKPAKIAPVFQAYKKIYDNAKLSRPTDNGINNGDDKSVRSR